MLLTPWDRLKSSIWFVALSLFAILDTLSNDNLKLNKKMQT